MKLADIMYRVREAFDEGLANDLSRKAVKTFPNEIVVEEVHSGDQWMITVRKLKKRRVG